jgi:hypothetical protein
MSTYGGKSPRTYPKDTLKNRTGVIYEKGYYEPGSMTTGVIELPRSSSSSPRSKRIKRYTSKYFGPRGHHTSTHWTSNDRSPRIYNKDTLKGRTGVIREKGYYQPGETTKDVIELSGGRRKTRKNKKNRKSKK